jgi:predicted GNAT family acetyltransferase
MADDTELDEAAITVRDNPAQSRFEVHLDGQLGGFARYERTGDTITFTHTEIDDAFEGQGLGGHLVREALDQVRADGHRVVARCPFVKGWIERHDDYGDLLAS